MGITFEQSGRGPVEIKLQDVSELAVQHGFVKKGAPEQADLTAFFKAHDCNALSTFRKRFCEQPLEPVTAGTTAAATAAVAQPSARIAQVQCTPEPLERYPELLAKWQDLSWRLVKKPGAAHTKPDDYYRLQAVAQQAEHGDVAGVRPMWSDDGSIDYPGQESFDSWSKHKGLSHDDAVAAFCRIYAEAHTPARAKSNFYK